MSSLENHPDNPHEALRAVSFPTTITLSWGMPSKLKELYDTQGYVIVPDLVTNDLFPKLQNAAEHAIIETRSGKWPYRRTVGRQFPPYGENNPDSWGVQHLMHPDLGQPVFAEWYTSDALVNVVRELLECNEDDLQMELFNMLINPESSQFALRWHRDDVKETATEEEERDALSVWHHGVQWNTALYRDACLFVVPGSHTLPRSADQRACSSTMDPPKDPLDMSGAIRVILNPGETVFYNSNILHCGTYDPSAKRATLHASMGSVRGGSSRARNVLQHGLNWMTEDRFRDTMNERGRKMLERLIHMKESAGEIRYSLAN